MKPIVRKLLLVGILVFAMGAPAAFADTSPAVGWTLKDWIFMGPPQFSGAPQIEFIYTNGVQEPFSFPIGNEVGTPGGPGQSQWFSAYSKLDQSWGGLDNSAALLWYAKNVNSAWMGQTAFPEGVKYTPQLVQQMASDHFAPSMVGGANPPGVTSGATTPATTKPAPTGSSGATTQPAGGIPTPAPSSGSATVQPSNTSASTSPPPTPAPKAPVTADTVTAPADPIVPPAVSQRTPPTVYAKRAHNDQVALGKIPPTRKAGAPWPAMAAALIILLAAGAVVLVRRRRLVS